MEEATAGRTAELLWQPPAEMVERCSMTRYMRWLQSERGLSFNSYQPLWEWSVEEPEAFWISIWDYFEVDSPTPYSAALAERKMPGARWFEGAELNYAAHLFRDRPGDEVAILHASELRKLDRISWAELRERVAALAAGLRALGVGPGDRVAAYLPNIPEAVSGFLASA